ncbi:hypothetical protein LguiA_016698 [Lonicera macranthoides]
MDVEALSRKLLARIQSLEQQGFIDNHFRICHSLKEDSGLYFFVDLVPIFFSDVRTVLNDMTITLNEPVVDYDNLDEYCIKIQGSAACIGACRMRKACSNLRQAIDDKSKDRCLSRLNEIKEEFHTLQIQLDPVLELEHGIVFNGL